MKIIVFIITFYSISIFSQHQPQSQKLFTLFDKTIGLENTDLSYGKLYTEKFRTLGENHHFLNTNQFKKGKVTYQNQTFYAVSLKYDTADDQLIVNIDGHFKNKSIILEKAYVSSFSIFKKTFFKSSSYGYLEILQKNDQIIFYKKNKKNKKKKLNEDFVYYKFIDKNTYFISYKNQLHKIDSKKDILKILPNQKKEISLFYKNNKKLRKQDRDTFFSLLCKKISNTLTSN